MAQRFVRVETGVYLCELAELFTDWNNNVRINDKNLETIVEGKTCDIFCTDGKMYDPDLMDKKVVCFGIDYETKTLTVRVKD